MDINGFFNELNAKNWRNNIKDEVTSKVESLLLKLENNKEDIIATIVEDLELLEEMKFEDKDEYSYPIFKKWVETLAIQNIQDSLNDE